MYGVLWIMTSWPSSSLERLIYTLIGMTVWSWAGLTALWAALFPRRGLRREGSRLVGDEGVV